MQLRHPNGEVFVPDGRPPEEALARTTHLAVVAHADDTEIMACEGILQCFGQDEEWFTSVVVTDGAGSPRAGLYEKYDADQMVEVRRQETRKAAVVGEYAAGVLLQYSSAQVKDPDETTVVDDLRDLVQAARPRVIYCHNLADKHDTHVAVTLRLITALRELPAPARPQSLLGCEVWRNLDWMVDTDKTAMVIKGHENLAMALLGVYDSQIAGGKRYDLATLGRWRANATYWESHQVDVAQQLAFAMDLTPVIQDDGPDVGEHVQGYIRRFAEDVADRVRRFS